MFSCLCVYVCWGVIQEERRGNPLLGCSLNPWALSDLPYHSKKCFKLLSLFTSVFLKWFCINISTHSFHNGNLFFFLCANSAEPHTQYGLLVFDRILSLVHFKLTVLPTHDFRMQNLEKSSAQYTIQRNAVQTQQYHTLPCGWNKYPVEKLYVSTVEKQIAPETV